MQEFLFLGRNAQSSQSNLKQEKPKYLSLFCGTISKERVTCLFSMFLVMCGQLQIFFFGFKKVQKSKCIRGNSEQVWFFNSLIQNVLATDPFFSECWSFQNKILVHLYRFYYHKNRSSSFRQRWVIHNAGKDSLFQNVCCFSILFILVRECS